MLYWAIVDILDSINDFSTQHPIMISNLKALFYKICHKKTKELCGIMDKYAYPNLKSKNDVRAFYKDVFSLCSTYNAISLKDKILLRLLLNWLSMGMNQDSALLLQDEEDRTLLKQLADLYYYEIYQWKNCNIIFDNESEVIENIKELDIFVDSMLLENYAFVDSKDDTMIQMSDVAVGIISRYLHFIDTYEEGIFNVIETFDDIQMCNFKKLNGVLKDSLNFNSAFIHQTETINNNTLFNSLLEKYS